MPKFSSAKNLFYYFDVNIIPENHKYEKIIKLFTYSPRYPHIEASSNHSPRFDNVTFYFEFYAGCWNVHIWPFLQYHLLPEMLLLHTCVI